MRVVGCGLQVAIANAIVLAVEVKQHMAGHSGELPHSESGLARVRFLPSADPTILANLCPLWA